MEPGLELGSRAKGLSSRLGFSRVFLLDYLLGASPFILLDKMILKFNDSLQPVQQANSENFLEKKKKPRN